MARYEWFLYQNGTPPTGPFSSQDILKQHENEELSSKALLFPVEGGEWKSLKECLPILQARCQPNIAPWFIFREGRSPLGPLDDTLLQRGIDAGKLPADALLSRTNGAAWYSQARALAEPIPPLDSPLNLPEIGEEDRAAKTAIRAAAAAPAPKDPVTRERMILAAFCAAPLLLGLLIALLSR